MRFCASRGPNQGLELTAYSVRSFVAPASSSSSGLALGDFQSNNQFKAR